MKPFDEWVMGMTKEPVKVHYVPDNVWSDDGGQTYYTECCVCGCTDVVDVEWFGKDMDGEWYRHHCGKTPRCCP